MLRVRELESVLLAAAAFPQPSPSQAQAAVLPYPGEEFLLCEPEK